MTFLFAWRYFKGKKTTNAVNLIAWISILAIAVGSAALILVLSVFNGFEDLVKTLYADFYTDLRISPAKGKFITLTQSQLNQIRGTLGVKKIARIVEEKAVLVNDEYQSIIYLKGVDDAYSQVSGLAKHIYNGAYNLGNKDKPFLFLGAGIENAVAVQAGMNIAPLTVYLPNFKATGFSGLDGAVLGLVGGFLVDRGQKGAELDESSRAMASVFKSGMGGEPAAKPSGSVGGG